MKPKVNAKACSVHIDADLRDEHGLFRHGGTPSPQRGEGAGRACGSPVTPFDRDLL